MSEQAAFISHSSVSLSSSVPIRISLVGTLCLRAATRIMLLAALTTLLVSAGAGCRKPLLSPDGVQTQFDQYDAARNRRPQPFLEDEFGYKKQNLRGRLLGRD